VWIRFIENSNFDILNLLCPHERIRAGAVEALKQYDNNSHNEDYYDALAWNGLKNTIAWNKLTPNQKTKILETIQTIYKNEKYCN
jgi:hypothetical protein